MGKMQSWPKFVSQRTDAEIIAEVRDVERGGRRFDTGYVDIVRARLVRLKLIEMPVDDMRRLFGEKCRAVALALLAEQRDDGMQTPA
jgi:hypothetical protein